MSSDTFAFPEMVKNILQKLCENIWERGSMERIRSWSYIPIFPLIAKWTDFPSAPNNCLSRAAAIIRELSAWTPISQDASQ